MTGHWCEQCAKDFASADALVMHNRAKHPELVKKPGFAWTKQHKRKVRNLLIVVGLLMLVVWAVYAFRQQAKEETTRPATEMNIGGHQNLALHIHADLKIVINGVEEAIPGDIGVAQGIMRPVHTHDASGKIHVEWPYPRDFTLGDFFAVWGKTLNQSCIFAYCTDAGSLRMTVNGVGGVVSGQLVLQDGQEIVIEYASFKKEAPNL